MTGTIKWHKGEMVSVSDIIHDALELKPQERYLVVEELTRSLDRPDPVIEKAWIEESLRRAEAYTKGELKTVSYEEVFGE